jgi:hypothetical protein
MAKLPVKMDDFIDDIIPMNRSDFPVRKLWIDQRVNVKPKDFLLPRAQVGNETDKVSSGKPGFRCAMVIGDGHET